MTENKRGDYFIWQLTAKCIIYNVQILTFIIIIIIIDV